MTNGRDRSITVDGPNVQWVCVVVIDHPDPSTDFVVPELTARLPVVVPLRRDWEFLFNQLRSTYAVVGYLHRVDGSTKHLGEEPTRYYELAAADAAAPTATVDTPKQWGVPRTVPLLPSALAGMTTTKPTASSASCVKTSPQARLTDTAKWIAWARWRPSIRFPSATEPSWGATCSMASRLPAAPSRKHVLKIPHLSHLGRRGPARLRRLLAVQQAHQARFHDVAPPATSRTR
jgi:hypothetical protein